MALKIILENGCSLYLKKASNEDSVATGSPTRRKRKNGRKEYVTITNAPPPKRYKNCLSVRGPTIWSSILMNCGTWNCCMWFSVRYCLFDCFLIWVRRRLRNYRCFFNNTGLHRLFFRERIKQIRFFFFGHFWTFFGT